MTNEGEDNTLTPRIWRRFLLAMTTSYRSFLLGEEEPVPTYRYCIEHLVPVDDSIHGERATCPVGHQTRQWLIVQGGQVLASASDKQTTWFERPRALSDFSHEGTEP